MLDSFKVLEIDKIKALVANFAISPLGKNACFEARPLPLDSLKKELGLLEEALRSLPLDGKPPFSAFFDAREEIALATKGKTLNEETLHSISVLLKNVFDINRFFKVVNWEGNLKDFALSLPLLSSLREHIDSVIGDNLEVLDSASPLLKEIRRNISSLEREIDKKAFEALARYKDFLTSSSLSYKGGHLVLAVSSSYKNKVKGAVIDLSSSGSTVFIEPESLLSHNNKIALEKIKERNEINRLLKALSNEVGDSSDDLTNLILGLGKLDYIYAKAIFADEYKGHVASLSNGELFLPEARHPLLDQNKAVPNSFSLNVDKPIIIISGPNAGGKTVALKTLGANVALFLMGFPVLCKQGALIPYFKNIHADIGDSQSLSDNLSTFSGHMSKIAEITSLIGGKDLVLLDELGTGTAPREGEALAIAVTKFLLSKHCFALISSHFEGLKSLALSNSSIVNASMLFDEVALEPTFRLALGLPGESYGLEVARRYRLDEKIIEAAKEEITKGTSLSVTEAIKKLASLTKETEDLKERLAKQEEEIKRKDKETIVLQNDLRRKLTLIEEEKKNLKEKALRDVKEQLNDALAILNKPDVKKHELIEAKKRLENASEEESVNDNFNEEINVGDFVYCPSLGFEGTVKRIKGSRAYLLCKGSEIEVDKASLKHAFRSVSKAPSISHNDIDNIGGVSLSLEINLIGMRADEALSALIDYLDRCRIKHLKRVRIIHGFGAGILRQVVREYLDKHPEFVLRYEGADGSEGAGGATIAYLR